MPKVQNLKIFKIVKSQNFEMCPRAESIRLDIPNIGIGGRGGKIPAPPGGGGGYLLVFLITY